MALFGIDLLFDIHISYLLPFSFLLVGLAPSFTAGGRPAATATSLSHGRDLRSLPLLGALWEHFGDQL